MYMVLCTWYYVPCVLHFAERTCSFYLAACKIFIIGRIMLDTQNSNQACGNFQVDTAEMVFYCTRNWTVPAWTNKLRGTADAKAACTELRSAQQQLPPKTSDAGASCAWAYSTRDAVDHQMRISTARLRVLVLRACPRGKTRSSDATPRPSIGSWDGRRLSNRHLRRPSALCCATAVPAGTETTT